jgi:hypothetical protein
LLEESFYKVKIRTSFNKSGTGVRAFIKIYDESNTTDRIVLSNSKTHKNAFEQGNTDLFELSLINLGHIKKIKYVSNELFV